MPPMKKPFAQQLQQLSFEDRKEVKARIMSDLNILPRSLELYVYGRMELNPLKVMYFKTLFKQYNVIW